MPVEKNGTKPTTEERPSLGTPPAGPWLLVVGMHRSGTSAITGAVAALGFHTPHTEDLFQWHESNPEHWESRTLVRTDDQILRSLGGSWEAPPDFPPGWMDSPEVIEAPDPEPGAVMSAAYPYDGPCVWKDPRVCLLLPYWMRILPQPVAALLVWRDPLPVGRSLAKRDDMHLADGIALWERYNRSALEHLVGVDTYVCHYESLLEHPGASLGQIASWLGSLEQFAGLDFAAKVAAAIETIGTPTGPRSDAGSELLFPQHHELIARLTALEGAHAPLGPTELPEEFGWTTALLAARRTSRTREVERITDRLHEIYDSSSWRMTQPIRNVIGFVAYRVRRITNPDQAVRYTGAEDAELARSRPANSPRSP